MNLNSVSIIHYASVTEAGLKIHNRKSFDKDVLMFNGKDVEIRISKKKRIRSNSQNRFYWGAVIPIIKNALNDAGMVFSSEGTHELLKFKCNQVEHTNTSTGEVLTCTGSTANMSTVDFMGYISRIRQWSNEFLNTDIPEPGEVMAMEFN